MRKSESKKHLKAAMLVCALASLTPQMAVAGGSLVTHPTTASEAQQQKAVAKGKVVDQNGEPLIGVSVVEAGTSNGTVTDIDGNFTLNLKKPGSKLNVSYVGFTPATVAANDHMNITMRSDDKQLNEIVVVGYGTQKTVSYTHLTLPTKA